MRFGAGCFVVFFLLWGCAAERRAAPPEFFPAVPPALNEKYTKMCREISPGPGWQFVHSIEFALFGRGEGKLLGVTVLKEEGIDCALMTIEGLTLFQARYNGRVEILQALPPFDKPEFARKLLDDLQAIFLWPQEKSINGGLRAGTETACRIHGKNGSMTDVVILPDGCWTTHVYGTGQQETRRIVARSCSMHGRTPVPAEIELKAFGPAGYTLRMHLVQAERLPGTHFQK